MMTYIYSLIIALTAMSIGTNSTEKSLVFPALPLTIILLIGWDLFGQWWLKKRAAIVEKSGGNFEDYFTGKDSRKARRRYFSRPFYFAASVASLIIALVW